MAEDGGSRLAQPCPYRARAEEMIAMDNVVELDSYRVRAQLDPAIGRSAFPNEEHRIHIGKLSAIELGIGRAAAGQTEPLQP